MLAFALVALVLAGCGREVGTYDISTLDVTRYRYVISPDDKLVHVVGEVVNSGSEMVEGAVVVVAGIGRNGEKRGECRQLLERIAPGERRIFTADFKNRARLATVEISLEPVAEEERKR